MKACDIKLDLEEVCAKVRPSLAAKIRPAHDRHVRRRGGAPVRQRGEHSQAGRRFGWHDRT